MITKKEIDAVRFYQGDIRKRLSDGGFSETEKNEGFFGIASAYKTMNCLMFGGVSNEKERIREKNARLNPQIFIEAEKTVEVFCDIYRAMCKNASAKKILSKQFVYRTERKISVRELQKGQTVSFTSASKENNPEKFLQEKSGLTLLDIVFPSEVPHLDFEEFLGEDYFYKNQKEILLPPFLELEMEVLDLTEAEMQYRDTDDKPPCGKYLVFINGVHFDDVKTDLDAELVFAPQRCHLAADLLTKMMEGQKLNEEETADYCLWKRDVRDIIKKEFYKIYRNYFEQAVAEDEKQKMTAGEGAQGRLIGKDSLLEDVRKMRNEFNKKRQEYKKKIEKYYFVLIVTNIIPLACIALSFAQTMEMFMKIAAVITSTVSILLSQILQAEVYDMKLQQRSKTYLELCALVREIEYETVWDKKNENSYILEYKKIMKEDTIMSLNNIELQIQNAQKMYQNEINV